MRQQIPSNSTNRRRSHFHRSGWSLLQLMVSLSVLSVISLIATRLVGTMLKVERQNVGDVSRLSSLARLARQLRTDVHAAHECDPTSPTGAMAVRLTFAKDHIVVYESSFWGITRTETQVDRVLRRELYRLPGATLTCKRSAGAKPFMTFEIDRTRPDAPETRASGTHEHDIKELVVDALLDRDGNEDSR